MSRVVAVDVDLTVVDSLTPWFNWLSVFTDEPVLNESRSYNLYPEMRAILDRAGHPDIDPLDFWRREDLYDNLRPDDEAYWALKRVKANGDHLVFVSQCFPEHEASKVRMLKKYFPFYDAFISTHDKHFIDYDVLVDDKLEHMRLGQMYRPQATHLLYTGIRADGHLADRVQYRNMVNWIEFHELV